jgi:hypothetical protein
MKDEHEQQNRAEWIEAVNTLFHGSPPPSASWTEIGEIVHALNAVCGIYNLSHTMLPFNGGADVDRVRTSREPDCIEFGGGGVFHLCKPRVLNFEYISSHPWNSFFLLDTHPLPPTGIYKNLELPYEELLRLPDGTYMSAGYGDSGHIGHDEGGNEIEIPSGSEVVGRELSGKFLIVAEQSLWKLGSATYNGRHTNLSPGQIRVLIQQACDSLEKAG